MKGIQTPIITDHPWIKGGIVITKDGSKWMAVFNDFVNLHVSPAGFGDTQEEAVFALNISSLRYLRELIRKVDEHLEEEERRQNRPWWKKLFIWD
jgi:hypothetical protein